MSEKLDPLPPAFEPEVYRDLWPDLVDLTSDELDAHYASLGIHEGRRANRLCNRQEFIALIPSHQSALEIGPFFRPVLRGPHVSYFDVLDQSDLKLRAAAVGADPTTIPMIDYVSSNGDLSIVDKIFDNVLSSHCLEHQPDLITHLQKVSYILENMGRYFLLIPDKRYCFDAFMAPTTIADVIDAYFSKTRTHRLKSVIEHRVLTTHNYPERHWLGDSGSPGQSTPEQIRAAILEYESANGAYVDVHAWYFTPESCCSLLRNLHKASFIDLVVEEVYSTRRDHEEFWMVLQKRQSS